MRITERRFKILDFIINNEGCFISHINCCAYPNVHRAINDFVKMGIIRLEDNNHLRGKPKSIYTTNKTLLIHSFFKNILDLRKRLKEKETEVLKIVL